MSASSSGGVRVNIDAWSVAQALWVLLTGTVVWLGRKALARLDHLETNAVLKADFDKAINEMRLERKAMHEANLTVLERIESKIDVASHATLTEKVRQLEERVNQLDRRSYHG